MQREMFLFLGHGYDLRTLLINARRSDLPVFHSVDWQNKKCQTFVGMLGFCNLFFWIWISCLMQKKLQKLIIPTNVRLSLFCHDFSGYRKSTGQKTSKSHLWLEIQQKYHMIWTLLLTRTVQGRRKVWKSGGRGARSNVVAIICRPLHCNKISVKVRRM